MNGADPTWKVVVTRLADNDILGIIAFIGQREGPDMADTLLERFVKARNSLSELPDRGRIPPELIKVHVLSFREIQVAPYRFVYTLNKRDKMVYLHMVVDGRRNIADLLKERLLTIVSKTGL